MRRAIPSSTAAALFFLPAVAPAAAASPWPTGLDAVAESPGAPTLRVGFDDGATTGSRHARRNRSSGTASKSIEPSHADLHGATRESADKAYRKQYGF